MSRGLAVGLLLALALLAFPLSASGQGAGEETVVVISGPVAIEEEVTAEDVLVVRGDTRIDGRVTGDVAVLSGRVAIAGSVDGDVFAASGQVELLDAARVGGDVRYGDADRRPVVAPGAAVKGEVSHESWTVAVDALPAIGAAALWLAMTISVLVLGLMLVMAFPRAAEVVYAQAQERLALAAVFGVTAFVAVPLAVGFAAVTLVGIPLALALLLALVPLAAVAYITTAWALGRSLVRGRSGRVVAFLAGLAILRALALIPLLGVLVWLVAVVVGTGLLIAAAGATRTGRAPDGPTMRSAPQGAA